MILTKDRTIRFLRPLVFTMIAAMIFVYGGTCGAFADVNISVKGASDLEKGAGYTVTVVFSGDDIGRVDGQASYDTSKLSYVSGGSSNGDNGLIELKGAGTGEDISFKLKFKAVGSGSTSIDITTNGVYDLEEEMIGTPSSSQQVTIAEEDVTTETSAEETSETEESSATEESSQAEESEPADESSADQSHGLPGILLILAGVAAAALLALIILIIVSLHKKKNR